MRIGSRWLSNLPRWTPRTIKNLKSHSKILRKWTVFFFQGFATEDHSSVRLEFSPLFKLRLPRWRVYVHDREEAPAPEAYAMGEPQFVTMRKARTEAVSKSLL